MKTRLVFLSGLLIALVLSGSTGFSAVANSRKVKPASKAFSVALCRFPKFSSESFSNIKTKLKEAGYTIKVVSDPKDVKGDGIDIGIVFSIQPGEPNDLYVEVLHNENKLLAKYMGKELGRRTNLQVVINEAKNLYFLEPEDLVLVILATTKDLEKQPHRYVKGVVEGVGECMDEM